MYPLHLWHVVEDVQSTRRHEAHVRSLRRAVVAVGRAPQESRPEPGSVREAIAFCLIEAGLRMLTPSRPAQMRRAR